MTTEQIVEQYLSGDVSAVADLVTRFSFAVREKLYLLRKDRSLEVCDLEYAVAEGVLVGLRRLAGTSESPKSPLSMIYSCVRTCLRKLERASIETFEFRDGDFGESEMSDEERAIIRIDLSRIFDTFRKTHRQVATLWFEGATERETAVLLNMGRRKVQAARSVIVRSIRSSLGYEYLHSLSPA